jgi:hypothetical protein
MACARDAATLDDAAYAEYTDVALAGAANAPFHARTLLDCAKAGAATAIANAIAAISFFMVLLPLTHLRERLCSPFIEFEFARERVTFARFTVT